MDQALVSLLSFFSNPRRGIHVSAYIFLSQLHGVSYLACVYRPIVDGWDAIGMYHVEKGALQLVFGSQPDSVPKTFWVEGPILFAPVVIDLDVTSTVVCSRWLPMQIV